MLYVFKAVAAALSREMLLLVLLRALVARVVFVILISSAALSL